MIGRNLSTRPDLRSFFGAIADEEHERLLDRLLVIDRRLHHLAAAATAHVGVPYEVIGLRFSGSMGIDGGPSGAAGDIWFDLSPSWDPAVRTWVSPPWTIESSISVFCRDQPEPRGEANTHRLLALEGTADTPAATIELLESHVSQIASAIGRFPDATYTSSLHASLP